MLKSPTTPTGKWLAGYLLLLLTLVFLSGFAAIAQDTRKDVGTLKLGWVKSTANLMAAVAPQLSEKHGLKVESINFNTAQDILTALIAGQVDVGLLTPVHL